MNTEGVASMKAATKDATRIIRGCARILRTGDLPLPVTESEVMYASPRRWRRARPPPAREAVLPAEAARRLRNRPARRASACATTGLRGADTTVRRGAAARARRGG